MKQHILIAFTIGVMILSGCIDTSEPVIEENTYRTNISDEGRESSENGIEESESIVFPDGLSVYSYITNNNYHEWSLWPGTEEIAPSSAVHGAFVTIYISDNALAAINSGEKEMPYGTVVVKDGFNENKELTNTVVMYKVKGYDPIHNDWFWASYTAKGDVINEGILSSCYNCHKKAAQSDYLFSLRK
ncbi:MAG: cytochrome P460 family protein [Methanomethylovorans sp.]|jgi:hypothetical protein|nr:cytochrome P460 family protein [Methanomethylovorans sp.]